MINLDPSLVDQESVRKQRRKRLMTIYAAPVAILLIIAGFFLSCTFFNIIYSIEYNNRAYDMAGNFSGTRLMINWLEPYLAYYDRGVAELIEKDYVKAEKSFNESLEHSPAADRLCKIYVNLSLSIEYQADDMVSGENYEDALVLYNRAEATLHNNGCASGVNGRGSDTKAEAAVTRINQKRNVAVSKINLAADANESGNINGDTQQQVSDEDIKNVMNLKKPINDLRGRIDAGNNTYCNIYGGYKCY